MILALQTTTFSSFGGIPTYNRLVCRVLNELAGNQAEILIATDEDKDLIEPAKALPNLKLNNFNSRRSQLACSVLRIALTRRVDLALIGHANYSPLGFLLKRIQPQARVGVLLYGIEAWQELTGIRSRALRSLDFYIAISDYTKRKAAEVNGLDIAKIHILPNALEWCATEPADTDGANEKSHPTTLLTVCRLDKHEQYKGVDHVIESLPKIAEKIPDVQYIVVGDGSDLERHKQLAVKLEVADRVHFPGFVGDAALRAYYRKCDVFVMPSGGEGFGFVFLEAMKFAKPIVAANSGGIPEVVQDGVTGTLVEFGNHQQLTAALVELCKNNDRRRQFGNAGLHTLEKSFSYSNFRDGLCCILTQEMPSRLQQAHSGQQINVDQA